MRDDIPLEIRNTLGHSTKARLNHMVHNIITNSMGKDDICMSKESAQAMQDCVNSCSQTSITIQSQKRGEKGQGDAKQLYFYYMEHIEELPQKYLAMLGQGDDKGRIICDYISGMTDQYATTKFHEYFVPVAWEIDGY